MLSDMSNDLIEKYILSYLDDDLVHLIKINRNFIKCVKKYLFHHYNIEYIQDKSCAMCKKNINVKSEKKVFPLPSEITRIKTLIKLHKLYGDLTFINEKKIVCHKCEYDFIKTSRFVPKNIYSNIRTLIYESEPIENQEEENLIHINNSFFIFVSKHTITKQIRYQYLMCKPPSNIFF